MSRLRLEIDKRGLAKVLDDSDARNALQRVAADIVQEARSTGPRNPRHSTHEIDQLAVGGTRETEDGAAVDIEWPSPVWSLIEFGSVNNPPYRPVTRAAQNQQLKIIENRT